MIDDIPQGNRPLIEAALQGKAIQSREVGTAQWQDYDSLRSALNDLATPPRRNEEVYEYRVRPAGKHVYVGITGAEFGQPGYLFSGTVCGNIESLPKNATNYLHVELDPDDLSVRVCEVVKKGEPL